MTDHDVLESLLDAEETLLDAELAEGSAQRQRQLDDIRARRAWNAAHRQLDELDQTLKADRADERLELALSRERVVQAHHSATAVAATVAGTEKALHELEMSRELIQQQAALAPIATAVGNEVADRVKAIRDRLLWTPWSVTDAERRFVEKYAADVQWEPSCLGGR